MENPIFKQAKDALERLSADPDARLRAEQREMALLTYEAGLAKVGDAIDVAPNAGDGATLQVPWRNLAEPGHFERSKLRGPSPTWARTWGA